MTRVPNAGLPPGAHPPGAQPLGAQPLGARPLGARIAEIRRARGWTQQQLAQAVGVTRSAVAQWETARAGQDTAHLRRIADALEVGVDFLLDGPGAHAASGPATGDEVALLRLYRDLGDADRQILLLLARRLAVARDRQS